MNTEDTRAVVQSDAEAPITNYQSFEDVVLLAEERVRYLDRVKITSLRATRAADWILNPGATGPKPYLQEGGALKIARIWGVKIIDPVNTRLDRITDDGKRYFIEEWEATFKLPGGVDEIRAYGARSSLDPFFQMQVKAGDPEKGTLPRYIDEADVKKAARANLHANGITQLLGLRNLTVEDLVEAGLNASDMQGISYGGKSSTPRTGDASELSLKDIAEKTAVLIKSVVGKKPIDLGNFLEERSAFTGKDGTAVAGKRSFKDLSIGRARTTYGRLKEDIESGKVVRKFTEDGEPLGGSKEE